MPDSRQHSIARFIHQYKGIEGFYFLNKIGELGYIGLTSQRSARETFPQVQDKKFMKMNPDFETQLERFKKDISEIPKAYLEEDMASKIELGYILPVADSQAWNSSTLVLHRSVVNAMQRDDKALYAKGLKDPFHGDPETEKLQGVRSIQQGFDDLLHHQNAFGVYKYFPVLFKLPDSGVQLSGSGSEARLRVLNLKWKLITSESTKASEYKTVFSILRANLIKRGAIAREKRIQNKFAIS